MRCLLFRRSSFVFHRSSSRWSGKVRERWSRFVRCRFRRCFPYRDLLLQLRLSPRGSRGMGDEGTKKRETDLVGVVSRLRSEVVRSAGFTPPRSLIMLNESKFMVMLSQEYNLLQLVLVKRKLFRLTISCFTYLVEFGFLTSLTIQQIQVLFAFPGLLEKIALGLATKSPPMGIIRRNGKRKGAP